MVVRESVKHALNCHKIITHLLPDMKALVAALKVTSLHPKQSCAKCQGAQPIASAASINGVCAGDGGPFRTISRKCINHVPVSLLNFAHADNNMIYNIVLGKVVEGFLDGFETSSNWCLKGPWELPWNAHGPSKIIQRPCKSN